MKVTSASKRGRNNRRRGADGEREIVAILRAAGYTDARRGLQSRSGRECPDVEGVPWVWIEVKRTKRPVSENQIRKWLDKAWMESKGPDVHDVWVVHRADKTVWMRWRYNARGSKLLVNMKRLDDAILDHRIDTM